MSVTGLELLLLVLFLSTFFYSIRSVRGRQFTLTLLSLLFLHSLIRGWATWGILITFLLSGYGAAWVLARWPRRSLLWAYILTLAGVFMVLKRYVFLDAILPDAWLRHSVSILGLSYMLFRQIHFVVDTMEEQIERPSLWAYLYYQLNVFTLISGPIQRFEDFDEQWGKLEPPFRLREEVLGAYLRILAGLFQVAVLGTFFYGRYEAALDHANMSRLLRVPMAFYSYPLYVYFNFSGYCSVVIGAASLLGIRIPENFDHPYRARNMIDYWNRWHITLSHWLRDYLFTPMYKVLARHWPRRSASFASPCFFVVFLFAGIWHGSTLNFVVFGLLHGCGVSAAKMWENFIIRRRGRKGLREYLANPKIRAVAIFTNLHFACLTFLFFPPGLDRCLEVIRALLTGTAVA